MPNTNHFSTESIYQGAFCLCRGMKLVGKEKNGNKITIFFDGKDSHIEAMKFYNGAKVQAKAYSDNLRTLKDYIFQK
jgi:hypothetical protein